MIGGALERERKKGKRGEKGGGSGKGREGRREKRRGGKERGLNFWCELVGSFDFDDGHILISDGN